MKSGIITPRDPYLMDPSLMVDPNLILDYGSSLKDDTFYSPIDPLLDLINCNDDQLENIILNSDFSDELCGDYPNPLTQNEFEFEDLLKDIVLQQVQPCEVKVEIVADTSLSPYPIIETDVANFEEVCSDEFESVASETSENTELENTDSDIADYTEQETFESDSVKSYSTESSTATRKRKLSDTSVSTNSTTSAPKRRKARRSKRVQDDRVKNQNKVAAMKYRMKKKDEKDNLDDLVQIEEEKNKKLKAQMEELKVNIDVLKELLGKYLSPSQLKANSMN